MEKNPIQCPFCADDRQPIFSSKTVFAVYDKYPVTRGHALILPDIHEAEYFNLNSKIKQDLWDMVDKVKIHLDKEFSPDGYNVGVNVGSASGQTIGHVHIHLIPRYAGDTPSPEGGVRGVIPQKQRY